MMPRYTKIAMTFCLAIFAFLVAFTNVTDYGGNQPFVQHVLSMDTTFRAPETAYRAITAPWVWALGYWGIIAGEALTATLMAWAAMRMFRARHTDAATFNRSKSLLHLAALNGFFVWFLGFMAIGGEWFLMWQSSLWNGQEAAFRFYVTILLVLIYVALPEGDNGFRAEARASDAKAGPSAPRRIERNGVRLDLHHIGIPVTKPAVGERHSAAAGMHTADLPTKLLRAQSHRFDPDSPLHPLLQTVPHLAFKVSALDRAIEGATVLFGPHEPFAGFRVAVIEDGGLPIELIETDLDDDEIWIRAESAGRLYADADPGIAGELRSSEVTN